MERQANGEGVGITRKGYETSRVRRKSRYTEGML